MPSASADWLSRSGYSPFLLTTFGNRFTACFRTANIEVETTKGCGKLEKNHQSVLP